MLPLPPTTSDLRKAYEKLQYKSTLLPESNLAIWVAWARFDPRLAEILVQYLLKSFLNINPLLLKNEVKKNESIAVLCTLIDIVDLSQKNQNAASDWKIWKNLIQKGVQKAPFQSFYIGVRAINSQQMFLQIRKNLKPFAKWGFYCDEIPQSDRKLEKIQQTRMGQEQRIEILHELLKTKSEITVNDYIQTLGGQIHRRQAERDLSKSKKLKKSGNTRSRIYKKTR